MDILSKLHTAWAAHAPLTSLLPATRLTTGRAPVDSTLPYAVVSGPMIRSTGMSGGDSGGSFYEEGTIRFQIWSQTYNQGRQVWDALCDSNGPFRNSTFTLDTGSVLNLKLVMRDVLEETDEPTERRWQFVAEFEAMLQTPRSSSSGV